MPIHPLALVSPEAEVASDVEVGPFAVIEPGVQIGSGCRIEAHSVVKQGTLLGEHNQVCEHAVIGGGPQHARPPAHPGHIQIGSHNVIREHCTVHRAMHESGVTVIGDHNLLMCNVHVAHDCRVGSRIIFANNVMLAGHVTVEDQAFVSGGVAVHQFCRIGKLAMVGGQAHVVQDVPPYVLVDGATHQIVGLNLVGLRRAGFAEHEILQLKNAYRAIYRTQSHWTEVLEQLRKDFSQGPAAAFLPFFTSGKRGFIQERRAHSQATIRLRAVSNEDETPSTIRKQAG